MNHGTKGLIDPSLAYIALGSNLGQRDVHLRWAVGALRASGEIEAVSSFYETAPVGGPPQPDYLNAVLAIRTTLSPQELLRRMLEIERERGRVREVRWSARTLDLDLLFYGDLCLKIAATAACPALTLPHPHLHCRGFVLVPLCEIAAELTHPVLGCTVRELLTRCPDHSSVRLFGSLAEREAEQSG